MLLKTRKFCLDKITKIKKLLTFGKKASIEEAKRPVLSYAQLLDEKKRRRQSFEKTEAISKSKFQLRLDKILEEYDAGISRWFRVCDLFYQYPESYVDKKYTKSKKTPTEKFIFRKKNDKRSTPFTIDYKEPKDKISEKQEKIRDFIENLYDEAVRNNNCFAKNAADSMMAVTKTDETNFVDTWEKYLKRTKKEPNVESFKTFLISNQKFTKKQINLFEVSATFHGKNLANYDKFKEEMERVKSL